MPTEYTQKRTIFDVIVIGGGAAGMLAALTAARSGRDVLLLEKNEKLGKKVYITGKGRCNVTNACPDMDTFLKEVPRNGRFLYSALNAFSPQDMMHLLEELGCPVKEERGRRVFPVSDKASDVTRALEQGIRRAGGRIRLNTAVKSLIVQDGQIRGVETEEGERLLSSAVIVCTGGLSYPSTGSTGDGYRFAEACGLSLTPTYPSLTGIDIKETWPGTLSGLSLKNVALKAQRGKKTIFSGEGEMLFTHFGISGPLVLDLSSLLSGQDMTDVKLYIDMKMALSQEQLDARISRELKESGTAHLTRVLRGLLPGAMADIFGQIIGMDTAVQCAQVSGAMRQTIVSALKALPLTPLSLRSFAEAIITRGGVHIKEIDPATMESKKVQGLYFAGEVLDVDAHTGGYNLQIAFSTGFAAGRSAAGR